MFRSFRGFAMAHEEISWESQWDLLVQQALQRLRDADLEAKTLFSEGLARLPYTAAQKTRDVVEQLRGLMEKAGLI
jgi:hypothetical protein